MIFDDFSKKLKYTKGIQFILRTIIHIDLICKIPLKHPLVFYFICFWIEHVEFAGSIDNCPIIW